MRYALVGDSHDQAVWPLLKKKLEAAGHTVVLQRAEPGWSGARYLQDGKIAGQLRDARPDVVVYHVSSNNNQLNAGAYEPTVAALIRLAKDAGAKTIYWEGPSVAVRAPWSAAHETTAQLEQQIVPRLGAIWIDTRPWTAAGHRSDGVHFEAPAYSLWATALSSKVQYEYDGHIYIHIPPMDGGNLPKRWVWGGVALVTGAVLAVAWAWR